MNNILNYLPLSCLCFAVLVSILAAAFSLNTRFAVVNLVILAVATFFSIGQLFCLADGGLAGDGRLECFLQLLLCVLGFLSLAFLRSEDPDVWEVYTLKLLVLIAGYLLIGTDSVLTWYISLEIVALSSYGLVAADLKSNLSAEAAIKYFLQGTIASICILFAITLLYGFSASLSFSEWANWQVDGNTQVYVKLAFVLGLSGLFLKLGLVPFHYWVADVYQGARANISNFLASVGKYIIAIALLKFVSSLFLQEQILLQKVLWLVVMLSVVIASCQILSQANLKRFFAYSAIVQSAYFSIALINPGLPENVSAYLGYLILYAICSSIIFGIISCLESGDKSDQELELKDLDGLGQASPFLGVVFSIALLGLVGMPPVLVMLVAKLNLIQAALVSNYFSLAFVLIFGTLVGVFYYFKLLGYVWSDGKAKLRSVPVAVNVALALLVILIGYYTIYPSRLFAYLISLAS